MTHTICPRCGASLQNCSVDNLCAKCLGELNFAKDTAIPGSVGSDSPPLFAPEEIAALFPQLDVLEVLGRGGMGVVYKARQKALGRLVALKLLAPERVADPKFAERFAYEAQALAALSHPNIVTIHDFGQAGGVYYLLMEFVDGVNLRQAMTAGRLTPEQALSIVPPVCEALHYAHEHGIVHRDIKPENLLLDKEGRVKIADFGIAKMLGVTSSDQDLAESQPAGTPQYMAPEQKGCRVADHRADIYSLGVVLYEMLTGELPADKLQPPSRKVQIDVRLDEIVLRALETQPERRYQTAADLRAQVVSVARDTGDIPRKPSAVGAPARFSRTAIVGACLVVMGGLSLFLSFFVDQMATRPTAPEGIRSLHTPPTAAPAMIGAALVYAFFATLLGWISVTQISRSAGKLDGLWLAVFDGLFFPLLALDALILSASGAIIWLLRSSDSGMVPEWLMLFLIGLGVSTVLLIGWVNFLIVRAVWRAVNRTQNDGVAGSGAVWPHWKKIVLMCIAIVLACIAIPLLIYWFFGVRSVSVQWSGEGPRDAARALLERSAQGPSLFTAVQESLKNIRTASYAVTFPAGDKSSLTWKVQVMGERLCRVEQPSGVYLVFDVQGRKVMEVNPGESKVRITENLPVPEDFNVLAQLSNLKASAAKVSPRLPNREISGTQATGFVAEIRGDRLNVWVDPATNLPLLVERTPANGNSSATEQWTDFRFNGSLDPSLFPLDVPVGFSVESRRMSSPDGAASSTSERPTRTRGKTENYGFGPKDAPKSR